MKPKLLPLVTLLAAGPAGRKGCGRKSSSGLSSAATRRRCATTRWCAPRPGHQDRVAEAHLVEALKAAPHTERLIADLAETVRGLDAGERERLYDVAFVQCFVSSGEHL